MSARRAAAAAAALTLLAPGIAHAQQSGARPAVGGGSFNDAPLLAPGRYSDTIRLGERLYYGFALQPGQRLHVRAVVLGDGGPVSGSEFVASVKNPMREAGTLDSTDNTGGRSNSVLYTNQRIDYTTEPVKTLAAADARELGYAGPGVWFVSLNMPTTSEKPPPIESPVELEVGVEGRPLPEPRPTATPTAAAAPAVRDEPDDGGGGWVVGLLLAGLAGLLVGLALVAVARLRSRPRSV